MREILFRGKRTDNGDWHEGEDVMRNTIRGKVCLAKIGDDWISVDPKTVGQYTGLKDKNGKKIFEGDIVRNPETSDAGEIYFDTNTATFAIKFASFIVNFCDYNNSDVEVTGNIYDNPELEVTND